MKKVKRISFWTIVVMVVGTAISFVCSSVIGYCFFLALSFAGAFKSLGGDTTWLIVASPALLVLIIDIVIIVKKIRIFPLLLLLGHIILTIQVWFLIILGFVIWSVTYPIRNGFHEKKSQTDDTEMLVDITEIYGRIE